MQWISHNGPTNLTLNSNLMLGLYTLQGGSHNGSTNLTLSLKLDLCSVQWILHNWPTDLSLNSNFIYVYTQCNESHRLGLVTLH